MSLIETLRAQKLLGIIRGTDPDASIATALALIEEGVGALEVSLTSADALSVLRQVASEAGPDVAVGAGTVLTPAQVDAAAAAGATYVVTPAVAPSVPYAASSGIPVLCGAMTPTEVVTALGHGVDAVKLFPANQVGPRFLKDLRAPFPDVPFVPVGGVDADTIPAWLAAGADAVGVASPLAGDAPNGGDLDAMRARARTFLAQVGR